MIHEVFKFDEARREVFGWASIAAGADGQTLTDLQGHQIDPEDLHAAAVDFMLSSRESGVMHEGKAVGTVIASLVTTPAMVAAFGLGPDLPVGWLIGVKVHDEEAWALVKAGDLSMFSIEGTATIEPVEG